MLWRDFIARHNPPQPFEELLDLKTQRVVEIIRREQPLFSGLPELIGKLAGRYTLALASGSERAVVEAVLRLDGLGRFFSAVVSGSDVKNGKPAPDIFLRAAELLKVAPRECWVIEDAKPGVAAGLAAGMRVIAITNTHPATGTGACDPRGRHLRRNRAPAPVMLHKVNVNGRESGPADLAGNEHGAFQAGEPAPSQPAPLPHRYCTVTSPQSPLNSLLEGTTGRYGEDTVRCRWGCGAERPRGLEVANVMGLLYALSVRSKKCLKRSTLLIPFRSFSPGFGMKAPRRPGVFPVPI